MQLRFFWSAVVVMLLAPAMVMAQGGKVASSQRDKSVASKTDEEAIMAQSKRFSEAYVRGDIETLVSIYTPDGVAIPGGRDYIRGREALMAYWTLPEGRTMIRHAATPIELVVDGDHAYDWGYFEGQAARNGEPLDAFRGTYTIIWKRGEDGVWRMAVDMWASLPPKQ